MITQKGLKDSDIFVLLSEGKTEATFNVGFEGCEKFSVTKKYTSEEDYLQKFSADYLDFKDSLASTVFTVSADEDEKELTVNDSWGSIFNDAVSSVKGKLFSRS